MLIAGRDIVQSGIIPPKFGFGESKNVTHDTLEDMIRVSSSRSVVDQGRPERGVKYEVVRRASEVQRECSASVAISGPLHEIRRCEDHVWDMPKYW